MKSILQRYGRQDHSDDENDIEDYNELPRFPLKKMKHLILMEENLNNNIVRSNFIVYLLVYLYNNIIVLLDYCSSLNLKLMFVLGKYAFKNFENIKSVENNVRLLLLSNVFYLQN